jgi:hypothetical protein
MLSSVHQASGVPMKDPDKTRARKEVTRRFRAFFASLQAELAEDAEEVWRRVESRLEGRRIDDAAAGNTRS